MFPLSPPPVSDVGAWTFPRQLQKWLDVNAVSKLTRINSFITLPAFTQSSNTWNGYSDIVYAFNFEGPNNFSLTGITGDVPSNPNYTLCISYRIGTKVTRYLLWLGAGSVMNQDLIQYTDQRILKNFRLEIWNTSQGVASQSNAIQFYTSVLGPRDYRWAVDFTLVSADSPCTNFKDSLSNFPSANNPDSQLYQWDWTAAFANAPSGPYKTISWQNYLFPSSQQLIATGIGFKEAGFIQCNIMNLTITDSPSLCWFSFSSNGIGSEAMIFGSFKISYDNSGHILVIFNGVTKLTVPFDPTILTNCIFVLYFPTPALDTVNFDIYDLVANLISSHSITGLGATNLVGPVQINSLNTYNFGYSNNLITSLPLVQYLSQSYNLPLTFPANSVSVTN